MTDKNVDILYSPQWDDTAANATIAKFDALKTKLREGFEIVDQNVKSSDFNLSETIVAGVEDATTRFDDFKEEIKSTAQEFERLGDRGLRSIAKIAQGLVGVGVGASLAFVNRFGATDSQAVEQKRATKQFEAAFEDLGRVASRFLTPALENLAGVVEVVAKGLDTLFPENAQNPVETFFNETIPAAAQSFNDLIGVIKSFGALVERDLGNSVDNFATNIRIGLSQLQETLARFVTDLFQALANVASKIPGLNDLATSLRGVGDNRLIVGPRAGGFLNQFQADRLKEQEELDKRVKDRNDKAADTAKEIVETNRQIADGLEATGKLFQEAKEEIKGGRIGEAEVNAFRERRMSLQAEQKQYDAAVEAAHAQNNKAIQKLEADRDKALTQLANDQAKAERELTDKYNSDKIESQQKFNEREEEIEAESQFRREQNARKHELTLEELAARGDVAGFIEEQKRYKLSLDEQTKTDAKEREQRLKAFEEQQADLDEQYATDLDKLHQSGIEKESELRAQYQAQEDELTAALTEQLNILYDKHVAEQQEIERAFLEELAMLDSNLAGLNDLRNSYYQQDLADLEAYLAAHGDAMRELYSDTYGVSTGENGRVAASSISSFDDAYSSTADRGQTVVFEQGSIQNTYGDIATRSMLEESETRLVSSIASGLRSSVTATEY